MNSKHCKAIRKFCTAAWNRTPDNKKEYPSLNAFIDRAKEEYKVNNQFRVFVKHQNNILDIGK